ncbi:MAG: hypothetical protein WBB28_28960 [Crinalium sp.]
MSDILGKNGKPLTGAALQKRLAKIKRDNATNPPLLGHEIMVEYTPFTQKEKKETKTFNYLEPDVESEILDLDPQVLDIKLITAKIITALKQSENTLNKTTEFSQKLKGLQLQLKERQGLKDYREAIGIGNQAELNQIAEKSHESSNFSVPLKDLNELVTGVDDLIDLVTDQDLRIGKIEQQINQNKSFAKTAKNLADVLLIGSFGGAIIGLCLGIMYPDQLKIGTTFGFVGGASLALLNKLNPVKENQNS